MGGYEFKSHYSEKFCIMQITYNYINILKKQAIITKKESELKILLFLNLKTQTKINILLNFILIKYIFPNNFLKINTRNNLIYITIHNLLVYPKWIKYFLKNKYFKFKVKKLASLFFIYDLKLFSSYRKLNSNINFYNTKHNTNFLQYLLLYK